MSRPKPTDLISATGWLILAAWRAAEGDVLLGLGFAVIGVAVVAAGLFPRVHDFLYRPIWRRRSDRDSAGRTS